MKDPRRLQEKLHKILKGRSDIRAFCEWPWNDLEFRELASVVKAFMESSGDVTNDDPLAEWLEEYHFFLTQASDR